MKKITLLEAKEKHDKLREILIKYGSEEYGDCIVDEISWLFNFPTTIDTEPEEEISFTYSFLRRKLDWMKFCELTGTNEYCRKEGREIEDSDIFYITESKAKEYNLL